VSAEHPASPFTQHSIGFVGGQTYVSPGQQVIVGVNVPLEQAKQPEDEEELDDEELEEELDEDDELDEHAPLV
jgi:hypothetical protein